MVDALFGDLGDVNHSLFARSKLDEGTELFDADYFTGQDLASLEVGYDDLDEIDGFLNHSHIGSAYGNCSVISDIDLHAGLVDDGVDGFTLLSYHIADLVRIDADLNDLGAYWPTSFLGSAMAFAITSSMI